MVYYFRKNIKKIIEDLDVDYLTVEEFNLKYVTK